MKSDGGHMTESSTRNVNLNNLLANEIYSYVQFIALFVKYRSKKIFTDLHIGKRKLLLADPVYG